jgi:hypothetical protein
VIKSPLRLRPVGQFFQRAQSPGYNIYFAPLFVAGPYVGDTQVKEAIHSVEIRRCFKQHLWLVRSGATAGIQNGPGVSELDVAGIVRLDLLSRQEFGHRSLSIFPGPSR